MKKSLTTLLMLLTVTGLLVLSPLNGSAAPKVYYVATNGADTNAGTKAAPFATFSKAFSTMAAGDTVYFRGGTYHVTKAEIMSMPQKMDSSHYCYIFDITKKSGKAAGRTVIAGYPGERPVFDFSEVKPKCRIVAFHLNSSFLHLKNFEIVGVKATCHGHYQSIAIFAHSTSNSIVENIAMHDNMAIGYYARHGHDNLVKNCDAYCNYDNYSAFKTDADYESYIATGIVPKGSLIETLGGNADGFGYHACHPTDTGNRFEGCRSWWNADDGYDCINSQAPIVWDHCWAFYNGYEPNSKKPRGDGNGFKAGGYGMKVPCTSFPDENKDGVPDFIPRNVISNCVAYENLANGFYANHHLGGCDWINDIAIHNRAYNYNMTNRDIECLQQKAVNVPGYGHVIKNSISYLPSGKSGRYHHTTMVGSTCKIENCDSIDTESTSFLDGKRTDIGANCPLMNPRQPDGSLPDIPFMAARKGSPIYIKHQGALFEK